MCDLSLVARTVLQAYHCSCIVRSHRRMLMEEVEGTCLGNAGFVISVYATKDDSITMGIIEFDTGFANVSVAYSAVCFR